MFIQCSLVSPLRDKVLKFLVELLGSSSKDLVVSTLRLTHLLMQKYEWRGSFATEGGVKAILTCMQEFSAVTPVQQMALAVSYAPTHTVGDVTDEVTQLLHCCVSDSEGDYWGQ